MKEIFLDVINQMLGGDVITALAIFIVGWITKTPVGIINFIKRKTGKMKDIIPDNVENSLVKSWDKVKPFATLLYKEVLELSAQEMLKEVNGEEANLSTGLRSTMRDVKIQLENKVKSEVLGKANELIDKEVKEKAIGLAEKVGIDLLEKAKVEIVNTEAMPKVSQFTMNEQTIAIIDKLKGTTKNHVYNAYAEISKEDGKTLEGKAGASITGIID